jgi:hypothetical protein
MTAHEKRKLVESLTLRGFDRSYTEGGGVRVKCSQCEAAVIQGVPCHERGCHNEYVAKHYEGDE